MNKFAYFKMMFPAEMRKMAAEEAEQEEQNTSKKEQKAKNKEKAKAENQASKSERRRSGKYHSELLGGTTSALTSGLLGALIGGGIGRGIEASPVRAVTNELGQAQIDPNGYPIMEPSLTPNGNHMWTGAAVGGITGLLASILANRFGKGLAGLAGPRTLKKQKDYNASVGQTLGNYFVPGMQGWNKARTAMTKDEQDAVMQEYLLKDKLKDAGLA